MKERTFVLFGIEIIFIPSYEIEINHRLARINSIKQYLSTSK